MDNISNPNILGPGGPSCLCCVQQKVDVGWSITQSKGIFVPFPRVTCQPPYEATQICACDFSGLLRSVLHAPSWAQSASQSTLLPKMLLPHLHSALCHPHILWGWIQRLQTYTCPCAGLASSQIAANVFFRNINNTPKLRGPASAQLLVWIIPSIILGSSFKELLFTIF